MSNINDQTMSKQALQEYLDRRHQDSRMITTADDPLFDSKIQMSTGERLFAPTND